MNEVIRVGNRVWRPSWPGADYSVKVTAVGIDKFLAVNSSGTESAWSVAPVFESDWELAPEPFKRYVVELRVPEVGESYLYADGVELKIHVMANQRRASRPVIVGEVTP